MKNIVVRAAAGAVYVAVIVFCILSGQVALTILATAFTALALHEFYHLESGVTESAPWVTWADIVAGAMIPLCIGIGGRLEMYVYIPVCYFIFLRPAVQVWLHDREPVKRLGISFLGQIYITLPLTLMCGVFGICQVTRLYLLMIFVMIWLNDTGAYLVGSAIGRHRLFERISPKKSWEGFFGGMAFTVGSAFVFIYCFPAYYGDLPVVATAVFAAVVSCVATVGDLFESMVKRSVGVKDSGRLIPGHGGILDRIDSLLFVLLWAGLFYPVLFGGLFSC